MSHSIIKLCLPQTTCCNVTAEYFARLLRLYLGGEQDWFWDPASVAKMEVVGDVFSSTCLFRGERQTMFGLFLSTVQDCEYGQHQSLMVNGVYKRYVLLAWRGLKELACCMKFEQNKCRLEQYILEAKVLSAGFNYRLQAKAMNIVL